jgi:predicted ATPase/transcriptional regulator with XRE-family HTH domain
MSESESSPFGDVLRHYRSAAGLSQERLAERTGLSVRGVSDLERGARRTPRLETVRRLADGLGLGPADRATLLRAARREEATPASPLAPSTLPIPPTPLVGRERELAGVLALLRDRATRLVTLTGPGGVGKSRLALEVASVAAAEFPHGAHYVELAPLSDPALVLYAVAHRLGVLIEGGTSVHLALARFLHDRHLLLVLDNVEHLLPAAPDIAGLLAGSPGLTVLATSREPLALRGEQQHPVPPLAIPPGGGEPTATDIGSTPAVQLFVARTRQIRPEFDLRDGDAPAVAAICRRLDGLPLALELAAAHTKTLPPTALLARLGRRLPLLTRGYRDLPERHQALEATIAWSHNLLPPGDQRLFRRLAVFARGWSVDAATAVIADTGVDALHGIDALANASMIVPTEGATGEPRFTMLETIREFALEQLRLSGEEDRTREAHAAWVLSIVERGGPELVGPNQPRWVARFDDERDNLRVALDWALTRRDADLALRLAAAAWQYWLARGYGIEGRRWLDRVLALAGDDSTSPALTAARFAAGTLAAAQDDYAAAEPLLEAALAGWQASGETAPLARTLQTLGVIALHRNDAERAANLIERAIDAYGWPVHPAFAPWHALAHSQLAGARSRLGDHERADRLAARGIALQRAAGSELGEAIGMIYLGDLALDRGDNAGARRRYRESIATLARLGDRWYVLVSITGYTAAAVDDLPPRRVARLLGANAAIRAVSGSPVWPRYAELVAAAAERTRAHVGAAAFERAWDAGATLDLDATIAEILDLDDASGNHV